MVGITSRWTVEGGDLEMAFWSESRMVWNGDPARENGM